MSDFGDMYFGKEIVVVNRCECRPCDLIYFAAIMYNNEKVIFCMDVRKCG